MIKKIFKVTSFFCFSIFLSTITIFSEVSQLQAAQITTGNNEENTLGIIQESNEDIVSLNKSTEIDLGDDQTFPFIPGFGKNSGKD